MVRIYKTATEPYPGFEYTPIDFGWELSSCHEYLEIKWFDGDQTPTELESIEEERNGAIEENEESEVEEIETESDESESEDEADF